MSQTGRSYAVVAAATHLFLPPAAAMHEIDFAVTTSPLASLTLSLLYPVCQNCAPKEINKVGCIKKMICHHERPNEGRCQPQIDAGCLNGRDVSALNVLHD